MCSRTAPPVRGCLDARGTHPQRTYVWNRRQKGYVGLPSCHIRCAGLPSCHIGCVGLPSLRKEPVEHAARHDGEGLASRNREVESLFRDLCEAMPYDDDDDANADPDGDAYPAIRR